MRSYSSQQLGNRLLASRCFLPDRFGFARKRLALAFERSRDHRVGGTRLFKPPSKIASLGLDTLRLGTRLFEQFTCTNQVGPQHLVFFMKTRGPRHDLLVLKPKVILLIEEDARGNCHILQRRVGTNREYVLGICEVQFPGFDLRLTCR